MFRVGAAIEEVAVTGRPLRRAGPAARPAGRGVGLAAVPDPARTTGWPTASTSRCPCSAAPDGSLAAGRSPGRDAGSPGRTPACSSLRRQAAAGPRRSFTSCRPRPTPLTTSSAARACTRARTGCGTGRRRATWSACSGRATAASAARSWRATRRTPTRAASRRQTFAHWDAPFVAWLESRGYEVAYCTDFDLHVRRGAAGRRRAAAQRRARRVLEQPDAPARPGVRGPRRQHVLLRRRRGVLRGGVLRRRATGCSAAKMSGGAPGRRGSARSARSGTSTTRRTG